ncbi:MAG: cytochrome C oxidase subunit IV family protein, partial [Thermomicrobiales bacterium]|nr:cytochrome C oxidase subunit IV family protein [Thermomicrobiales bacterium]
ILTVITALEVATYYIDIGSMLVWVLLILSALKFGIVIGYYMHLKFDNRLFTFLFLFGVVTALCIVVAFLALFDRLW